MINIKILCLGKLKEKFFEDAKSEYAKRLSRFCNLEIIELSDEKLPNSLTQGNINIIKEKEAKLILNRLDSMKSSYIISLDETGNMQSSVDFSNMISEISNTSSNIVFVIGGSLGLSNSIKSHSNCLISFSKMTFPHQLFRVMLLEQLFRAFKINSNEQYHH